VAPQVSYFRPTELDAEKAAARQRDEAVLRVRATAALELSQRNGMFGALRGASVRIVSRQAKVRLG